MNLRFIVAMARREGRAARRRFFLYGSCMTLGIAALVGLHGLRETVRHAVDAQSQRMLGADLRLMSRTPYGADLNILIRDLESKGTHPTAQVTRFGSMALVEGSSRTRLVDVHAVDPTFPLYGRVETNPEASWPALQSDERSALVDPSLLVQLDVEVGERLRIGEADFRIRGIVTRAPGAFGMMTQIAPRIFIARRHAEATDLLGTSSMVEYRRYLRVGPESLEPWLSRNREALDAAHVHIQTLEGYQDELGRSFGILTRYLGLVGLAALALGGVGVAAGVRVFVREKLESVALLRSLGAAALDVISVYGLLAIGLGVIAGVAGAVIGVGLQWLLPALLQGLLPVAVEPRIEASAVMTGLALGFWVTLLFALGPLVDLGRTPPLRALRRDFGNESRSRLGAGIQVAALAASLIAAAIWQAPSPLVGLWFAAGLASALLLLAGAATAAILLLRLHHLRHAPWWLRQGIANLFRPRNHTLATTVTIGFGIFLVATLHGVQHNVLHQIAIDTRPDRPNLVLFDVQYDQVAGLEAILEERGAPILDRAPLISARILGVRGRPNEAWLDENDRSNQSDRDLRWALQREYRLTHAARLRESETLVAGRYWGEDEESQKIAGLVPVSMEEEIAAALGVGLGDRITWEIQGVAIESMVASLRRVDWGRMATNFFAVFPPRALEDAPQSTVILTRVEDDDARAELQRDVVAAFPNISALDASQILRTLDVLLGQIWMAVRVLSLFALATGLLVLVAASATAKGERMRESLLLRTLGARHRIIERVIVVEALALGILSVGVGTFLSIAASWALVAFVFEIPFDPPMRDLFLLAVGTLLASVVLGSIGGRSRSARSPLAALREVEVSGA